MKYETNEKHFKLFEKEVKKWLVVFGLKGWHISVSNNAEVFNADPACLLSDTDSRTATFILNPTWTVPITKDLIKKVAFHEVCELLFSRLRMLAKARFCHYTELDEEFHAVIRTLENTMLN